VSVNEDPNDAPEGVDLERPNAARIYDYLLGGKANWAIDRMFGDQAMLSAPLVRPIAKVNRAFLGRAVRYCANQGVTQFLDIGSGVPTVGNVHEIADEIDPTSRCVYVDYEPVAVAHSRILLERHGDPSRHAVVQGDMRDVGRVWQAALDTGVLDPTKPIGLIMAALLHFVPDDEQADKAMKHYRRLLPSGSYFALSHVTDDGVPSTEVEQIRTLIGLYGNSSTPARLRDREHVEKFFGDFSLVDPGVVWLPEWHSELGQVDASAMLTQAPAKSCLLGGVAKKS
jgi:O-methyltransferase involved in polyketide biosynthesis